MKNQTQLQHELEESDFEVFTGRFLKRFLNRFHLNIGFNEPDLLEQETRMSELACDLRDDGSRDVLALELGSYLGQFIIRNLGGGWIRQNDEWLVSVDGIKVYPFQKARKRIENGGTDSLTYFYRVLKRAVEDGKPQRALAPKLTRLEPVPEIKRKP